jgi:hypothetical protein
MTQAVVGNSMSADIIGHALSSSAYAEGRSIDQKGMEIVMDSR